MVIMHASIRILIPLSIRANHVKTYGKTIFRAFASRYAESDQRSSHTELASNIIKSPVPYMELPEVLTTDMIWSNYKKWPDSTALVCGITGRELKYKQLRLLCRRLATSLLKDGHKPGEVIAVLMPNMPEFGVVTLGLLEAGLIATLINPLYTADEIAYHLKDSQAVAIVTIPEKLQTVQGAKAMLELQNKEYKLRIICTNGVLGSEPELPNGVDRYSHMVADNVDDSVLPTLQSRDIRSNDTAIIPYSSGTTGKPKGVCLSHRNIVSTILSSELVFNIKKETSARQPVLLFVLPGFHVYGFNVHLAFGLYYGVKLVTIPQFEGTSFLNAISNYKVTYLFVVPPLIQFLGASPNVTEDHLKSVESICSGAASLPESDLRKVLKKLQPKTTFIQGYGLTETSSAICATNEDTDKVNSVGVLCLNSLLKVTDLQTGKALGPNESGEICVKGPQIMKGYLNNEKANAEVFDREGWFHTGDVGYYDNDQYIYITERIKELIKVKGFQVAPAELEALIKFHPKVADAAVVGVPDDRKGETPIAFVQLIKGATVTKDELKAFLAPKVTDYKQIDTFVFVQSIPKNAAGKILRKDLKTNYLKEMN